MSDNYLHNIERGESRDAAMFADFVSCYEHDYRPRVGGGGICLGCGDEVTEEEL